ncbi:retrotransposon gag domain-containing protein, partial [Salmonella enterica]|nr:retrotransposon gag domain-containing protein [Salmonella enterica]
MSILMVPRMFIEEHKICLEMSVYVKECYGDMILKYSSSKCRIVKVDMARGRPRTRSRTQEASRVDETPSAGNEHDLNENNQNTPPAPAAPVVEAATPTAELVTLMTAMREQIEAQAVAIRRLNESVSQLQRPPQPPVPVPVPQPVAAAPVLVPAPVPLPVQQEPLYVRFKRMKPPEFNGAADPLVAEGWITAIQDIMRFMGLSDQEKVLCASFMLRMDARFWWDTVKARRDVDHMTWEDFLEEFQREYYSTAVLQTHQDELNKLKQGDMTVSEAVRCFNQLARLCPSMVATEKERVRRLMEMFRSDIALIVDSGKDPPLTATSCISRA